MTPFRPGEKHRMEAGKVRNPAHNRRVDTSRSGRNDIARFHMGTFPNREPRRQSRHRRLQLPPPHPRLRLLIPWKLPKPWWPRRNLPMQTSPRLSASELPY